MLSSKQAFRAVLFAWLIFFALVLVGAKTEVVAKVVLSFTVLVLLTHHKLLSEIGRLAFEWGTARVSKSVVVGVISLTFVAFAAMYLLDFEALNGTLWDLAFFIQAVFNQSHSGVPEWTFTGTVLNYNESHRSLSVRILGLLYGLTSTPWAILLYQAVLLVLPGIMLVAGYRAACKNAQITPQPFGAICVYLIWAVSPAVMRQEVFPYAFHILGLTLFSLAYYLYFQRRWALAALPLLLLPFEKEDFGVYTIAFGLVYLFDGLASFMKGRGQDSRARVRTLLPIAVGILLCATGAYSFISFHSGTAKIVTFGSRFGSFGQTPREAVISFVSNPLLVIQMLGRPDSFAYLFYFFAISFVWFRPRWDTIKYLIPFLPVLLLNSLADYPPMQSLKDPYALMLMVGAASTLLYGVFAQYLKSTQNPQRAHLILLSAVLLLPAWGYQSTFRIIKERISLFVERSTERQLLEELRNDKSRIVCCEERLCTTLADRHLLLEARFCRSGTKLLEQHEGQEAYYLIYTGGQEDQRGESDPKGPHVKFPEEWKAATPLLKLSSPVLITR